MPDTEAKTYTVPAPPGTLTYLLKAGIDAVQKTRAEGLDLIAATQALESALGTMPADLAEMVTIGQERVTYLEKVLFDTADWALSCAVSLQAQGFGDYDDPQFVADLEAAKALKEDRFGYPEAVITEPDGDDFIGGVW